MAQLLVEHGAAVFLRTSIDLETALEKCEEDAEGGQRTAEYLFCTFQANYSTCRLASSLQDVITEIEVMKKRREKECIFIVRLGQPW